MTTLVTISGVDGSGKSVFAGRLLEDCADRGVRLVLLRVDDYRRKVSWSQPGRTEAEIYYEDYFDFAALDADVTRALAAGEPLIVAEGVLIGCVPSLASAYTIYLDVTESVARSRIVARDTGRGRTPEEVQSYMDNRYFPAQRRYREAFEPAARAHLLIDNDDVQSPRVVRGDLASAPAAFRSSLKELLGKRDLSSGDFGRDLVLAPNLVSLARIVFILLAALFVAVHQPIPALIVGIPAGLTDYLDGYLARKLNQVTEMGALLDLLADVLFSLVCFTVSVVSGAWPAYLLLVWGIRDMSIMAVRASAAQQGFKIPSTFLSKVAANFNAYAFLLMGLDVARLAGGTLGDVIHYVGLFGIHAGLLLQWITGLGYVRGYAQRYRGRA